MPCYDVDNDGDGEIADWSQQLPVQTPEPVILTELDGDEYGLQAAGMPRPAS